jgi:hypothetical protein
MSTGMDCAGCGTRTPLKEITFVGRGQHSVIRGLVLYDALCRDCRLAEKGGTPTPAPPPPPPPAPAQEPVLRPCIDCGTLGTDADENERCPDCADDERNVPPTGW